MITTNAVIDRSDELASMAYDCGIDFHRITSLSPGVHKKLPVIKKKYAGKCIMWVNEKTTRSGVDYLQITFHTKKHGGITHSWCSLENDGFKPRVVGSSNTKKAQVDESFRKELFLAFRDSFKTAPKAESFPYLDKKGIANVIGAIDLKLMHDGMLKGKPSGKAYIAFPLFNHNDTYVGLQRIYEDGSKKLTTGLRSGQYKGAYNLIGEPTDTIYIAEGFASAASIHLATGKAVAFAYSANNLDLVAAYIKARYDDAKVIIAADNDVSKNGNTGLFKALEAARNSRIQAVFPPAIGGEKTDWNDYHQCYGLDELNCALGAKENTLISAKNYLDYLFQLLKYVKRQELGKLVKKIASYAKVPFLMDPEKLFLQIVGILGKDRADLKLIRKAIRAVEIASTYQAKKIAEISPKSVDKYYHYLTEQNKKGHWVLSCESVTKMIDELEAGSIVIKKGPMGIGKTELAIKLAMGKAGRAAHILPRISVVDDASKRLNIDHYRDVDEIMATFTDKIVACINSLAAPRFIGENDKSWFSGLDLLCLDEASQSLPQIVQLGKDDRRRKNYEVLKEAINTAHGVLVADADANEFLIDELRKLAPDRKIVVIESKHPVVAGKSMDIHFTDSTGSVKSELLRAAMDGKKCLMATDNKRLALEIERLLKELAPGIRILNIHREPRKADVSRVKEFYDNPNQECLNYDVIIYSPAITSGVSITTKHFERRFGIFTGTIKVNDIIQMIGRDRTADEWLLGISARNKPFHSYNMDDALTSLGEKATGFSSLKESVDRYESEARTGMISLILNILKLKGHKLHLAADLSNKLDTQIQKLAKEIRDSISEERIERLINQDNLTEAEYQDLIRKWLPTREDAEAIYAYEIKNHLCSEITESAIEFMDEGGLKKVELFETLLADSSKTKAFDNEEKISLDPAQRYFASEKQKALLEVLSMLGVDENFEGEFTHKDCQKVVNHFLENADRMNHLFGGVISQERPPRNATSFVMKILSLLGISVGKRKSCGRMIRFLDLESIKEMLTYRRNRMAKGKSFLQVEVLQAA